MSISQMLFKQRKPRKFSYKPRTAKDNSKLESGGIKSHWEEMRSEKKGSSGNFKRLIIWLVALGMIIVLWYVLSNYQN